MRLRKSKAYYIALLVAGVGGLILGFVLGAKDAAEAERDEAYEADLDPEGLDLGLMRTDMGCVRKTEEK